MFSRNYGEKMDSTNIGIISLGLIGGSLLKALSKKNYNLFAVTGNPETLNKAKKYTAFVSDDLLTLKNCNIVFVCSPMNKTLKVLDDLEKVVQPSTIVADVSSLKEFVLKKERPYIFIGSHPMAGTENSGFDASFSELFDSANWVLTPSATANEQDIKKLESVIIKTGAKISIMNPEEHDRAAALISHMPMLIAQALMKTAMNEDLAIKLASSGFRDMTRLALSNTEMAEDMIKMNSKNISKALIDFVEQVRVLLNENYRDEIENIKDFRKSMYNAQGKNVSN